MHWVGLFWPNWKGRPASPKLNILINVTSQAVDLSIKNTNNYPTRIAQGPDGKFYVTDALAGSFFIYNGNFNLAGELIGIVGELNFPVAIAIHYNNQSQGELLYVTDQGHAKVQVYDLLGKFITSYGEKVAAFSSDWEGKFSKIQSLAFDEQDRLHALDCYSNKIQILDPGTGQYLNAYGTFGSDMGQLNLPLDIFITNSGQVVVTNAENHRVEIIYTITAP